MCCERPLAEFFSIIFQVCRGIRIIARLPKFGLFFFRWCVAAVAVAGVVAGFFYYRRLNEEIRAEVESILASHYQHLSVSVGSARWLRDEGVRIRDLSIVQPGGRDDSTRSELAYVAELLLDCDLKIQNVIQRQIQIRHLHLRGLVLRPTRLPGGNWNLNRLLPLPSLGQKSPSATVDSGTIEIVDAMNDSPSLINLREVNLNLVPKVEVATHSVNPSVAERWGRKFQIVGSFSSDYCQRAEVRGIAGFDQGYWDFSGRFERLEYSAELRRSLPEELSTRLRCLDHLRVDCGFDWQFRNGPETGGRTLFKVTGSLTDGRWLDPRLPNPISDITAGFSADNQQVSISNAKGSYGAARVEANAWQQWFSKRPNAQVSLRVQDLNVDRQLVAAMPEAVRQAWEEKQLQGLINANLILDYDGESWNPNGQVKLRDVSLLYKKFPFPLENCRGLVDLTPGVAKFNLEANTERTPIFITGRIQNPGTAWRGNVRLVSRGYIPIDDRLFSALNPKGQSIFRSLRPRGRLAFDARFVRDEGEPKAHRRIRLHFSEASLQHKSFPYPIYQIQGSVDVEDSTWTFRNFHGRNDSAVVQCHGSLTPTSDGNELDLRFDATDVPLEEELRQSLSPSMAKVWSDLRLRGTVDELTVAFRKESAQSQPRLDVRVHESRRRSQGDDLGITCQPIWFPYALKDVSGDMCYRDGELTMQNLRAVHGRSTITSNGDGWVRPHGAWQMRLTDLVATGLLADREFVAALPGQLSETLTNSQVSGSFMARGDLVFSSAGPGVPVGTRWDIVLDIDNASIQSGVEVNRVFGDMHLVGSCCGNHYAVNGELNLDSLFVKGLPVRNLQGPIRFQPGQVLMGAWADRSGKREARRLQGQLFGGSFLTDVGVAIGQESQFNIQAKLNHADIDIATLEYIPTKQRFRGKLHGEIKLTGNTRGRHTLSGEGQVRLRNADIYELPLMVNLLKLLSIRPPDKTAFTSSDIDFRVQGDNVDFSRIDFEGDAITLKGEGSMNFDRSVDIDFYTLMGRERTYLPVLKSVLGEASRQFLLIRVDGTLDRPVATREVLPGLNERFQQLFPEAASTPAAIRNGSGVVGTVRRAVRNRIGDRK